jgi:hypothetical protein
MVFVHGMPRLAVEQCFASIRAGLGTLVGAGVDAYLGDGGIILLHSPKPET